MESKREKSKAKTIEPANTEQEIVEFKPIIKKAVSDPAQKKVTFTENGGSTLPNISKEKSIQSKIELIFCSIYFNKYFNNRAKSIYYLA